jgi:hypothetical protein
MHDIETAIDALAADDEAAKNIGDTTLSPDSDVSPNAEKP